MDILVPVPVGARRKSLAPIFLPVNSGTGMGTGTDTRKASGSYNDTLLVS